MACHLAFSAQSARQHSKEGEGERRLPHPYTLHPYTLTARAPRCARSACPSRRCTSPNAAQPWSA
eukprot:6135599-Alexandrium_andersonii.AAC.1